MRNQVILTVIFFFGILIPDAIAQSLKEKLEAELVNLPHPQTVEEFISIPHLSSENQDTTLVCWSFATSSFIESELKRLGHEPVRLSVMFPVYYSFIEKAKWFVHTRGESHFGPGDLFSGVLDIIKQYGVIPAEVYEGVKTEQTIYSHSVLYEELEDLIDSVKSLNKWDEDFVLPKIRDILGKHLGTPPVRFIYRGKEFTPKSFLSEVVNLPWEQYIIVTSFQYAPFNQFIELKVPDNWKRNANFFNVPLNVFYESLTNAVSHGYSVAIDMDNSESSYKMTKRYAFIPEFDVPKDSLTQTKREEEFQSGETTDDHVMHIVAYKKFGSEDWFLAKDSWRIAWEGSNNGYFFFHESYVKLKVLAYLVHKGGVPEIRNRLP